ncbi:hypothetical protein [Clostridium estertheticum]|uniref:hypothetical protein n=1 Tax=Clostridium estertheticum TaxID=238834 RepID=UPI001CF489A7|nr:hypothetical protein [Clostridium estertheticum]MCB2361593.1 hypothetical protein [Clostridium estertheticum]
MRKDINIENVKKLFSKRSSRDIFYEAFNEILPRKDSYGTFIVAIVCSIIPAIIISISSGTVNLFVKAIETLNGTILASFGIIFTGYAFFQALLSDDLLLRLLDSTQKNSAKEGESDVEKSKLQESNEYFANIMMLDVFAIFINAFMIITIGSLGSDFSLPIKTSLNNIFAFIGIYIYLSIMFCIILEMKSFIFNTFQLFNAHAGSKAVELLNGDNTEEDEP